MNGASLQDTFTHLTDSATILVEGIKLSQQDGRSALGNRIRRCTHIFETQISFKSMHGTNIKKLCMGTYINIMSKYTLSYDKQDAIKSATGIDTPDVLSFSQVHHEGTLIRFTSYGKMDGKRNSSICLFRNSSGEEVCGVVDRFCMVNSKPFAL